MSPSTTPRSTHSTPPPADHVEPSTEPGDAFADLGVGPAVASALASRGYTVPTPVQIALLNQGIQGRDVMCSAQTGSGKTVAFGLVLAPELERAFAEEPTKKHARPTRAVVITPTRELAAQVRDELDWLLAPLGARAVAVTGGTSIQGELRALAQGADVVVGTPGRLFDHLRRGALDPAHVGTVVLDEADEMLDMGFRDELEGILKTMPTERRTLMLSATFPQGIVALAKNYMRDAVRVAVEPPGSSNANITHIVNLVPAPRRLDALVNLLLSAPDERTLIFVRTRAEAADIGGALEQLGFAAGSLTGEMAQRDRTRTLEAFRAGRVVALVATDVAARGIDVPEISRVVHLDLPHDGDTLTHRAGRTGRAGRKGESVLVVAPFARRRATELLRAAGVRGVFAPVPDADAIRDAAEKRFRARLEQPVAEDTRDAGRSRREALARSLVEGAGDDTVSLVAKLLAEVRWDGVCEPRVVAQIKAPDPRDERYPTREGRAPFREERGRGRGGDERHVMFRVNFGERDGANPSRLLAMVCRRGDIRGADVGAISIGPDGSTFGVAPEVAESFQSAASRPDRREPNIRVERADGGGRSSYAPPRREVLPDTAPAWRPAPPPRDEAPTPAPRAGGWRDRRPAGDEAASVRPRWEPAPARAPRATAEPVEAASDEEAVRPAAPVHAAKRDAAPVHAAKRDAAPSYAAKREGASGYGAKREGGSGYAAKREGAPSYGAKREGGSSYGAKRDGAPSYGAKREGGSGYAAKREGGSGYAAKREGAPSYGDKRETGATYAAKPFAGPGHVSRTAPVPSHTTKSHAPKPHAARSHAAPSRDDAGAGRKFKKIRSA